MKKRDINKVIVLTLSLVIAFSTVTGARIQSGNTKSSRTATCYVDPYPKEGGLN